MEIGIPSSRERVAVHTAPERNRIIAEQARLNVERLAQSGAADIERRLAELEGEWDIERALEANAALLSLAGLSLAALVDKRWAVFPAVIAGFLLQHAVQGWCPPVPVLRRLGFRTPQEIEEERYALKILRGDFQQLVGTPGTDANSVMQAIRH